MAYKNNLWSYPQDGNYSFHFRGGKMVEIIDPEKTYSGIGWMLWGAYTLGFKPNKVLEWTEKYNQEATTELAKGLDVHPVNRTTTLLPKETTLRIMVPSVEIQGGLNVNFYLSLDEKLQGKAGAKEAIITIQPTGSYINRKIDQIRTKMVNSVGADNDSTYENLYKQPHEASDSWFQKEIKGITIAGYKTTAARFLDFEIAKDEQSQEILRAMRAKVVEEGLAEGRHSAALKDKEIIALLGAAYAEHPQALEAKKWEAIAQLQYFSNGGNGLPVAIPGI